MIERRGVIGTAGAWVVENATDDGTQEWAGAPGVGIPDGLLISPATKTDGGEPWRLAQDGDHPDAVTVAGEPFATASEGLNPDAKIKPGSRVFVPHMARRIEAGNSSDPATYRNEWTRAERADVMQLVEVVNGHLTYGWAGTETLNVLPFHQRCARDAWERENPEETPTRETVAGLLARLAGRMLSEPLSIAERIGILDVADTPPEQWEAKEGGALSFDMRFADLLEQYGGKGRTMADAVRKSARERWATYQKHPDQVAPLWALWVDPMAYPAPARWFGVLADCLLADVHHEAKQVERVTKATKPHKPERWPMSVDSTAVRVQTGLAGGVLSERQRANLEAQGINRLSIRWDDGEQLELDFYQSVEPLAAVSRKYGPRALMELQTALFLQWQSWTDEPDRAFPWWPNEHAAMQGSESGRHRDLFKMIERLSGSILTAYYEDGEKCAGPILALDDYPLIDKRGNIIAGRMKIHPALSRSVFGKDKSKDPKSWRSWWPQPVGLLKAWNRPDGTGRHVGTLAVLVGQQFNIERGRKGKPESAEARIKARSLSDRLGHKWRTDRPRDKRTGDTLKGCLDAAVEVGVIGSYDVQGGDLADPDAVVVMRPHVEIVKAGAHSHEAPKVPATGRELEAWVNQRTMNGDKRTEIAESLKVTPRALRNAMKRGDRLLTASMRTALRKYLWAEPKA